jgi:integrase
VLASAAVAPCLPRPGLTQPGSAQHPSSGLAGGGQAWTVEEARRFLESAHADNDPLYAVWVLILVLGLRKGEVLGLTWPTVDLDAAEVSLEWQLQRVGRS